MLHHSVGGPCDQVRAVPRAGSRHADQIVAIEQGDAVQGGCDRVPCVALLAPNLHRIVQLALERRLKGRGRSSVHLCGFAIGHDRLTPERAHLVQS
eukprot:scaffold24405_cov60-Phaeocystis_antarctica.AAC.1